VVYHLGFLFLILEFIRATYSTSNSIHFNGKTYCDARASENWCPGVRTRHQREWNSRPGRTESPEDYSTTFQKLSSKAQEFAFTQALK
jgi:hypothetical protein